jgi:hypothetical protein
MLPHRPEASPADKGDREQQTPFDKGLGDAKERPHLSPNIFKRPDGGSASSTRRAGASDRLDRRRYYLFPGRDEDRPIDPTVLHAACRSAVKSAGLTKRVTLHTLHQVYDAGVRVHDRLD